MWNLPPGFMSAMCGTLAAIRLKSSRCRSTPASLAIASRCSTALVEPPSAEVTAMAFSNAFLVMIIRGVMPETQHVDHGLAGRRASSSRRASIAGGDAVPGNDMPIASAIELIVLAVNMPPHAPSPGHALRSISPSSVLGDLAERAGADGLEHAGDVERHAVVLAGQDASRCRRTRWAGRAGPRPSASPECSCRNRPGRRTRRVARRA